MQRTVDALRVPSEAISGEITSTTFPSENMCAGACVCAGGSVMKFTYATEPPHWVREVLVDLLNRSIIQRNVDLIMHSEASLEIT